MPLDGIGPVITDITAAGLVPTLLAVVTFAIGFLAGVFDSVLGSEDEDANDADEPPQNDGGALFDDAETEFEPGSDDPFGGDAFAAEQDSDRSDLEPRIEQLEEEVSNLSSTVSTVRTENEQISDAVGEVEENVRKLLDIYKMVTKGVNPFVDQQSGGVAAAVDENTLGIFEDDDDDTPEEAEDLDDDVMEAEAEAFFDDGFETDSSSTQKQSSTDDADNLETAEERSRSFDDLKSEYDAEVPPDSAPPDTNEPATEPAPTQQSVASEPAVATDTADESTTRPDPHPVASQPTEDPGRPYLNALPPGVANDQLVLEWIGFLIDVSDPESTYNAITHYERLGWLGDDAAAHLKRFIVGHPQATTPLHGTGRPAALTMDHHIQSLKYIARLSGSRTDLWLWGNELSRLDSGSR